ncbi:MULTISPECIES: TetR/AcrR family transcriptional regulator [Micrococcaceae]|uniref:TetR/AcrR family transcriptional regulator n=1 Tax=Micrococcaceae TaxID=1268 RepID=UPI00071E6639|nr:MULTISPECIES: TetR/AcrR family transcriptional regulator [Micrococcaceae]KSU65881.1 TetR family transcriptional regulator [Arthrobacter sp. NIO-1057]UTT40394.1 TetR/AcrR family transcriptional regulator [Glutamicibacter mishrai]SCC26601.1 transcriptional regulator, TetR family [Arthrobacter sp. NIO-1057]
MEKIDLREKVLDAAEKLYYAKGFTAVGMDELRATAGVSLKRIYALFPAKTDIIAAVLQRKHNEWESSLHRAVLEAGTDAHARLLAVYNLLEQWFCSEEFRGCAFINAFGELGGTNPEVARIVKEHKADFQMQMAKFAKESGLSSELAYQLSLLAEGAQTTAAISADPQAAIQARAAAEVLIAASLRS